MKLHIALLPGDGIGEEIITQAVKCVDATCRRFGHEVTYSRGLVGAAAIDATGDPYPEATHRLCVEAGVVLFGAVGSPRYDNDPSARVRPEQGLLAMRGRLGLYANLRPVNIFPSLVARSPLRGELLEGVDILCVRELTGGIYFGRPRGRSEDGETAYDTCVYTREEVRRVCALAFEQARRRRGRLTVVDKANVLATSRLWRETAREMAPAYPDVTVEYMFVDNAAMQLVRQPAAFDVIVTENLFGDILTDEAGAITGSLGLLPSASVGAGVSLFEPIHGSYPQAAGKDIANPVATILSAAMMFEHAYHLHAEGAAIRRAVATAIADGFVTEDISADGHAYGTRAVGSYIAGKI
ncbi:MAG: 3-isopropylmalate dehydrogenase [Odoribacteraceae bacterium]|jgi:3-isopropylmalate dehydrogenase|nr:3-isopropylmalate dehydrogenase [Odoribacteraceae bacterium]